LEEAYNLANDLRVIFHNKKLDKEAAKVSFTKWYGKVAKSTLRETAYRQYLIAKVHNIFEKSPFLASF
jgi:hypothetical protein